MRNVVSAGAIVLAVLTPAHSRFAVSVDAQSGTPATTYEGSDAGGWSGPCESWWENSNFPFDAMRVCRVTTYLIHGFQKTPDWNTARSAANQLFRICWGRFPRSGSPACGVANAWAT